MTDLTNEQQRVGALFGFGRELSDTPRGHAVAQCLYLRALRSWVKPGAYAWWRLCDDIQRAQKAAAALRDSDRYPVGAETTGSVGEADRARAAESGIAQGPSA